MGSVPGGDQLQLYTPIGPTPAASSEELVLTHQQELHITIIAGSNAGTQHSDPYLVDTPFQWWMEWEDKMSTIGGVNWSGLVDPESGLRQCAWAIGKESTCNMHDAHYNSVCVCVCAYNRY